MSNSISYISEDAFENCYELHTIAIPPRTYDKFSKMLPRNAKQLHEINMDGVKSKLILFLELNVKNGKSYWESLIWIIETMCSVYSIFETTTFEMNEYGNNGGIIIIKAGENNTRDGNGNRYICIVNNRNSIDDVIKAIIRILLDYSGVTVFTRIGSLTNNLIY